MVCIDHPPFELGSKVRRQYARGPNVSIDGTHVPYSTCYAVGLEMFFLRLDTADLVSKVVIVSVILLLWPSSD